MNRNTTLKELIRIRKLLEIKVTQYYGNHEGKAKGRSLWLAYLRRYPDVFNVLGKPKK